jgi:hypothetical protein
VTSRQLSKPFSKANRVGFTSYAPHEPEELLLMAKLLFEADPEQLCAHLTCEREWDKVAKIVSNRMGVVGPLVRHIFSCGCHNVGEEDAFDEYVEDM